MDSDTAPRAGWKLGLNGRRVALVDVLCAAVAAVLGTVLLRASATTAPIDPEEVPMTAPD
jgi:hypothetical protein